MNFSRIVRGNKGESAVLIVSLKMIKVENARELNSEGKTETYR